MKDFYSILNEESNTINIENFKYANDENIMLESMSAIIQFNAELAYNETVFLVQEEYLLEAENKTAKDKVVSGVKNTVGYGKAILDAYAKMFTAFKNKVKELLLKFTSSAKVYISKYMTDKSISEIESIISKKDLSEITDYPISNIYEICTKKKLPKLNMPICIDLKKFKTLEQYIGCTSGTVASVAAYEKDFDDRKKILTLNTYLSGINFFDFVNCLNTEKLENSSNYEEYKNNIKKCLSGFKYEIYEDTKINYNQLLRGYKNLNESAKSLIDNSFKFIDSFLKYISKYELTFSASQAVGNALKVDDIKIELSSKNLSAIKHVLNDTMSIGSRLTSYLFKVSSCVARENLRIRKYLKSILTADVETEKVTGEVDELLLLTDKSSNEGKGEN